MLTRNFFGPEMERRRVYEKKVRRLLRHAERKNMANLSKTTRDHDEIRRWAEERGGKPAHVKSTGSADDVGMLRIDFPGFSGEGSLEPISWEEFFEKFDERGLALVYQEETAGGQRSNFNKLVSGETASESGAGRGRRGRSRSSRSSPGASKSSKSSKPATTGGKKGGGSKKAAGSKSARSRTALKRASTASSKKTAARKGGAKKSSSRAAATKKASGKKRSGTRTATKASAARRRT
jgi:hypothetical protein